MKPYVEGKLPIYNAPKSDFTPGGNGVGVVTAVGKDVWHVKRGQRVVISSHVMAGENVEDPGQFLLGVTAIGSFAEAMQADWPNGTIRRVRPRSKEHRHNRRRAGPPIGNGARCDDAVHRAIRVAANFTPRYRTATEKVAPFRGLFRGRPGLAAHSIERALVRFR